MYSFLFVVAHNDCANDITFIPLPFKYCEIFRDLQSHSTNEYVSRAVEGDPVGGAPTIKLLVGDWLYHMVVWVWFTSYLRKAVLFLMYVGFNVPPLLEARGLRTTRLFLATSFHSLLVHVEQRQSDVVLINGNKISISGMGAILPLTSVPCILNHASSLCQQGINLEGYIVLLAS